jgi:hypothetical protein
LSSGGVQASCLASTGATTSWETVVSACGAGAGSSIADPVAPLPAITNPGEAVFRSATFLCVFFFKEVDGGSWGGGEGSRAVGKKTCTF